MSEEIIYTLLLIGYVCITAALGLLIFCSLVGAH